MQRPKWFPLWSDSRLFIRKVSNYNFISEKKPNKHAQDCKQQIWQYCHLWWWRLNFLPLDLGYCPPHSALQWFFLPGSHLSAASKGLISSLLRCMVIYDFLFRFLRSSCWSLSLSSSASSSASSAPPVVLLLSRKFLFEMFKLTLSDCFFS